VRRWLHAGGRVLPEAYLDMALDEIATTQQRRRRWWPQIGARTARNAFIVFAAAGAAIVLAWAVGAGVLDRPSTVGEGARPGPPRGFERRTAQNFVVPFDYDAPILARSEDVSKYDHEIGIYSSAGSGYGVGVLGDVHVYRNPCNWRDGLLDLPPQPEPMQLANAVHELPGYSVLLPVPVMLGGLPATQIDLRWIGGKGCDPASGQIRLRTAGSDPSELSYPQKVQLRWTIVAVDGKTLVFEEWSYSSPLANNLPELDQILKSVHFH